MNADRRRFLAAVSGVALSGLAGCGGSGAGFDGTPTESATPAPVPTGNPDREGAISTVATFEGLGPVDVAVGPGGDLYMAMGVSGQVRRLPADRTGETGLTADATDLVAELDPGNGFLYALDTVDGTVYAANSSRARPTHGVWQVPTEGGEASRLAAFDTGVRLRGLFADGPGRLLVTDARAGTVSSVDTGDGAVEAWLDHPLFDASVRGPTGLVALEDALYVTNFERGRVVRVPVAADGSAGEPATLVEDSARLSGASGVTTDGRVLYVAAANLNRVVRVGAAGRLRTLATETDGLDLPTGVAVGPERESVFVVNFGFEEMVGLTGNPSLMRLRL